MILNGKDVTDEEFFKRVVHLDEHFEKYMINFIIPETVAFYLKECFYKECLCNSPLYNHINSTMDMLCNYQKNINDLIPQIEKILFIKYNLKITNYDSLEFDICIK